MKPWVACLDSGNAEWLAALRLFPHLECLEIGDSVWVRGADVNEALLRQLRKIPALDFFELLPSGKLKAPDSLIPQAAAPVSGWRPLREVIRPELPPARLAGECRQKQIVSLVRGGEVRPAAALLTRLAEWLEFARLAPEVRLEPLAFAASEERQILVIGQPLPSVPGLRLTNDNSVLFPCGYTWSPAVSSAVLREMFDLGPSDLVVLAADGTQQIIRAEQLVRANRASARLTAAAFNP